MIFIYIWLYICGGLGVDISWLPPRRAHACTKDHSHFGWKTTSYFLDDASAERSSGNSVRIPKRFRAAPHFCGGSAFVKISAAWSLVSTYSMVTPPSANTSDKHDKFTLCVLVMCLSLGLYPFLTTRMVAWLSSITRKLYGALEEQLPQL